MRLLVTGGAGFIGSHYVRSLLNGAWGLLEPDAITVLDALTYAGRLANLRPVEDDPRLEFVHGDICDSRLVEDLMGRVDVVVHFAAETHVDRSIAGSSEFVRSNVVGTQTLLDAALSHGVERFVHVSTDEVYGSIDVGSWAEDAPLQPNSPYSASKAGSDLLVRAYHRTHDLPACITRCCNNYGPYQYPEKVIPLFLTRLQRGQTVPLYGDGGNVREWLHVDDHSRGVHLVATGGQPGEVYNIGGGEEMSNLDLTRALLAAAGAGEDRIEPVTDRLGHDRRYSLDWSRIHGELGYEPRIGFTEGLAETVAWYRDRADWWSDRSQP